MTGCQKNANAHQSWLPIISNIIFLNTETLMQCTSGSILHSSRELGKLTQ